MAEFSVIVPLPRSVADNKESAFAPLAGRAPLAHSVHAMLGQNGLSEQRRIVVACAPQLLNHVHACLADGLSAVVVAVAGDPGTRTQCVAAGLEYLAATSISSPYVLVHDYRRPLASADVRDRVIAKLRSGGEMVIPVLPLVDSVKAVDSVGSITGTVDRSALRTAQYPRGFTVDRLSQLVAGCPTDSFDELQEAIRAGLPVTMVEGDPDAFVVEIPRHAQLVEAIISRRRSS